MIERFSLNSLKFFYYVALYGSVTLAAKHLFVTQGAVSKQIKNLEEQCNFAIFDREGKQLVLTVQGKILFECCQHIFQQLDHCLIQLNRQQTIRQNLVVSCEPTIAMKWLIPRLNQFQQLNHGFEIVLLTGGGKVDFSQQAIDVAIRRDDFDWGCYVYHEKMVEETMFVVTPPHKVVENNILISTSRAYLWQQFLKFNNTQQRRIGFKKIELEHFYLCIEGCLAGLGNAVVSGFMIEKELQYQMLKPDFSAFKDGSSYCLLSQQPFHEDERKMLFKQWLMNEMKITQQYLEQYV
ncbi:MAG: LysR family transcriptional regulator [Acinetobacter sp.]